LPSSLTRGLPSTLVCSTCRPVSVCGTGRRRLARTAFLGSSGSTHLVGHPNLTITPHLAATRLDGSRRWAYPPASPTCSSRRASGTGMLTGCPSPTARALGLGPTHPQLMTIAAEPCDIRWEGFAPSSRYSYRHSHSSPLQVGSRLPFTAATTLPYHSDPRIAIHGVGGGLSPGTLSAPGHTRPVSYYALFQGWLLLSQPPGCLRARTSLSTESTLRDLSRWSGLFPSRRRILAPAVSLLRRTKAGIRSLVRVGKR
jgi:hypothetical protein